MNNEEHNDPKKIRRKTVVYKGVKIELADKAELASRSAVADSFEAADVENVEKTEIVENNIEEVSDEGIVPEDVSAEETANVEEEAQDEAQEEAKEEAQEENGDKDNKKLPSVDQLKQELRNIRHKKQYGRVLRSTVYVLLISAACAVLVATIFLPILQIYGTSMEPTLSENEIVIAFKTTDFEKSDLVAFYIGNKLLVKRFIAGPGQWVDIDEEGNVYVDGELLDEPYLEEKAIGACNIELPYQVPENKYFVMGDQRSTSVDSRNTSVGCIDNDQIVGKLLFRVWPFSRIGTI